MVIENKEVNCNLKETKEIFEFMKSQRVLFDGKKKSTGIIPINYSPSSKRLDCIIVAKDPQERDYLDTFLPQLNKNI